MPRAAMTMAKGCEGRSMLEEWLTSANLAHLLPQFRAHHIDYPDLPELTDAELRELGLSVGERRRFRRALATSAASAASGERRPLTLAFFDLVDSSALCEVLDVEDMVEVLRLYREVCCAAVDRYGGHVAHLMGDGVLAYFCYPVAHEDDAERAVRAATEITEQVCALETPANRPLAVRCGIATGRVVVTELFSGRAADKNAVTGSIANVAARLQGLAPPNGIILSEATHRMVSHLFESEDLGEQWLKGLTEPVRAYRVGSKRAQPRTPSAEGAQLLSSFVGRKAQLDRLLSLWQQALEGSGRAVLVQGEAGIGKSRLVGKFLAGSGGADEGVVRLYASAFDEHSPLRPFLVHVLNRLALAEPPSRSAVAEALKPTLPKASDAMIDALAGFVVHDPDSGDSIGAEGRERRAMALEALTELVAEEAARQPLRLVVEDAHWLDASSKELLGQLVHAARERPMLVIMTSRRPLSEILTELDAGAAEEMVLGPLSLNEVRVMIRTTFGDEPVPREVVARIAERTDGVPLFVEELLRPLLHASAPANWHSVLTEEARPGSVPATLHEALTARLDRLGAAKEVAQVAAVLGRSIELPTLAHVMEQPAERLADRLDALCAAGVLRREPSRAGERYSFSHALVRDAAYDSLLRERRQRLHVRVAEALQDVSPQRASERPDIIARHLTEGGRPAESLPYWLAAGRAAAARSALHEARHVLECGAEIAASLPQTPEMVQTRLEFASLIGPVLFALCGPGSNESRAVYKEAVALSEAAPDNASYFAVLWGWWRLSRDFGVKAERARMLMRLADQRGEPEMLLQAHHCNWASSFHAGEFAESRRHAEEGLKIYETADFEHRPWLYGNHDAKVCAHGELAQVFWMHGRLKSAFEQESEALAWAERQAHAGTQAHAFDLALLHRYYRRDVAGTRAFAERMIALAEDRGMTENRARGRLFLGWALAHEGDPATGLTVFEDGYRRQRAVGTDEDTPAYVCMFAEILNLLGDHARALHELQTVCAELERLTICNWVPEVWRLSGESALRETPENDAVAREAFATAARVAAKQDVVMLGVRNALSRLQLSDGEDRDDVLENIRALRAAVPEPDRCVDLVRADAVLTRGQRATSRSEATS